MKKENVGYLVVCCVCFAVGVVFGMLWGCLD